MLIIVDYFFEEGEMLKRPIYIRKCSDLSKFPHEKLGSWRGLGTRNPHSGASSPLQSLGLTWHLASLPCTVVLPLLSSGSPREREREGASGISTLPWFSGLRSDGINQSDSMSKSFNVWEASPPSVHCLSFNRLWESAGAKQNQRAPLGSKARSQEPLSGVGSLHVPRLSTF